jgi:hypothetical protein
MFATVLYAIIVMRKPCGEGVARVIFPPTDETDAGPPSVSEQYPGFELMTAEEALKRWPDSPAHDAGAGDAVDGSAAEHKGGTSTDAATE